MRRGTEEKVPGGLAVGKKPSDFNPKQLGKGRKVEMEHTTDPDLAREIAMDHLTEDPDYYKKLEVMESQKNAAHRIATRYFQERRAAESAKQAFAKRTREVNTMWAKIERRMKKNAQEFKTQGETDWGYVGDLGYIIEQLGHVMEGWDE